MKTLFIILALFCFTGSTYGQSDAAEKVLELVTIEIKEGTNKEFEEAITKARAVISRAKGFISYEAKKCVEQDNKYIFLIYWESVDAHMNGFRGSALYQEYRSFITPFFKSPPVVQHFN